LFKSFRCFGDYHFFAVSLINEEAWVEVFNHVVMRCGNQYGCSEFSGNFLNVVRNNFGNSSIKNGKKFICNPDVRLALNQFCQFEAITLAVREGIKLV